MSNIRIFAMQHPVRQAVVRLTVVAACVAIWASAIRAQLPTAELHWLSRQAAQVGQPFDLALHGNRLDELRSLLITDMRGNTLSLDVKAKMAEKQPLRDWEESTGVFSITTGTDQNAGLVEVRTVGRLGASNSRTLLLTQNPVVLVTGEHSSMLTALDIEFEHILNAQAVALQSKYFRLAIGAGEKFQCAVYSRQIDSSADIRLRLLDANGHELLSARSSGYWPAELVWHNSTDQATTVCLEIRDLLGRGGPQYGYLLECRKIDTAPVDSAGSISHQSSGHNLTCLHLDELLRPTLRESMDRHRWLSPLAKVGDSLLDSTLPAESGSGNQPAEPSSIEISSLDGKVVPTTDFPLYVRGDLSQSCQVDFSATQGQVLTFEVASAKFGQLTDPGLVIYKRDIGGDASTSLRWIGDSDDAAYCGTAALRLRQTDPNWVWTVPEDGQYQLRIVDNQSGSRPKDARAFLLEARVPKPSFSLVAYRAYPVSDPATAKPWGNGLIRYGTDRLHVTVLRRDGFAGPVELSIIGLPEHCVCYPVIVQPGATEATLVIQASDAVNDETTFFQVVGKAVNGPDSIEVLATAATLTAAATPAYNTVLSRKSGRLELTSVSVDVAPLQVSFGDGQILETKADSKLTIPLRLRRSEGSVAECIVRPQDLPPKVALAEVKIPADQSEVSVELTIPGDMPVGDYTFWGLAETKVKWQVNPQALERETQYLAKLQASVERLAQPLSDQLGNQPEGSSTQERPLNDEARVFTKEQLDAAVALTSQRIEQLKAQTSPQEITVWLPTNTVRLRVTQ